MHADGNPRLHFTVGRAEARRAEPARPSRPHRLFERLCVRVKELVQLLPLIGIFLLIYLLMIRPTMRRNRDLAALQSALGVGDEVMLTSGFFGTVRALDDDRLRVELADAVVVSVARGAVAKVVAPAGQPGAALDDTDETGPGDLDTES